MISIGASFDRGSTATFRRSSGFLAQRVSSALSGAINQVWGLENRAGERGCAAGQLCAGVQRDQGAGDDCGSGLLSMNLWIPHVTTNLSINH